MENFIEYKNRNSGVKSYFIEVDSIKVKFKNTGVYTYNYYTSGRIHVENMKKLAINNKGLATYISKNKPGFIR